LLILATECGLPNLIYLFRNIKFMALSELKHSKTNHIIFVLCKYYSILQIFN